MTGTRRRLHGHQLYYFAACPYCIKVRLALWWMGIDVALKNILTTPRNRAELMAGGGKTQVPCLRIGHDHDDIQWMYESADIIRYLRRQAKG